MSQVKVTMRPGWEKALEKVVQPALKEVARDYERMFDSLTRRYQGRPVSQIKPVLRREWRKIAGGDITDPDLTKHAECVRDGIKVKFRTK